VFAKVVERPLVAQSWDSNRPSALACGDDAAKQRYHDVRPAALSLETMRGEAMLHELASAFRSMFRHPGFTAAVVLTMALGIGTTISVFSVAYAVLMEPLPVEDPDRLVTVSIGTRSAGRRLLTGRLDLPYVRSLEGVFEGVGARSAGVGNTTLIVDEEPWDVPTLSVSFDYLRVMGVKPLMGRTFSVEDAVARSGPDDSASIIVSHRFWLNALSGDKDAIGRRVSVSGRVPAVIIGVLPKDFRFMHVRRQAWLNESNIDVFATMPESTFTQGRRDASRSMLFLARLKPGATMQQAQAALDVLSASFRQEVPAFREEEMRFNLDPLREYLTADLRPIVLLIAGAAVFLMLLVCLNVSNLLLVRARVKGKEDAVRAAVGCGKLRLCYRAGCESLVLALCGAVVGIGLAWWGIRLLVAVAPPTVPFLDRVTMNVPAVLVGLGVAVAAGVLVALLSILEASRVSVADMLKQDAGGSGGRGRRRFMNGLVVCEVALSMVLLTGAALMFRTLQAMVSFNPGFEAEKALVFDVNFYGDKYRTREAVTALYSELEGRLRGMPGVEAVGSCSMPPFSDRIWNGPYGWDQKSFDGQQEYTDFRWANSEYFKAMGTRLLAGRLFDESEMTGNTTSIVIDAELARKAWPGQDPIGKRVIWDAEVRGADHREGTVIGVVEHQKKSNVGMQSREAVYFPRKVLLGGGFVVRASDPQRLAGYVRDMMRSMGPGLMPRQMATLSELLYRSMASTRFVLAVMAAFAVIALVLAAVGLFGVISYAVRTRKGEIGMRMALGAERRGIMRMVVGQGIVLALAGLVIGALAALALSGFMRSIVWGVSPTDPLVLLATGALLAVVSAAACYWPARWASSVDPALALRVE
jgi:predicted permease